MDSGSEPNLVKIQALKAIVDIDKNEILKLQGISNKPVYTTGTVNIDILGTESEFHVVENSLSIPQDAILGAEFHGLNRAAIDWDAENIKWKDRIVPFKNRETVVIPSRSSRVYHVRVRNTEITEGYIPRLNIHEGVYIGEAVVTNTNGVVYMKAFNTTGQDVELTVPTVTLEAFEFCNLDSENQDPHGTPSMDVNSWDRSSVERFTRDQRVQTVKADTVDANEVISKIKSLLRLDHLNEEERAREFF